MKVHIGTAGLLYILVAMCATRADTSARNRGENNNSVSPNNSGDDKDLQDEKPTLIKTESDLRQAMQDLILDPKLKENETKYSTQENDEDSDYEDEDDDFDKDWNYDQEIDEDETEYDDYVENLSRKKRRKTKFTKKTFGYGGSKGGKTSSGIHGLGHGDGFEGSMGRRKKKGKFSNEYYIKRSVLKNYDRTTRPVKNDSTTVTVYIGMSLYHILDTNEKFQTLSALIAVRLRWEDEYLTWDPKEYEGVDEIWIPAMQIWRPDIFINNLADDSFQDFMNTYSIVTSDGSVLWMFPAVMKTYCTLDVRHFPFDRQHCKIIFISWTFNGFKLNVTFNASEHQTVYYTPRNQEWYVDQISVERNEKIYACCAEPYPDVTFTIHMTRRSLFYIINLIFPCLLIYAVSFLGFFLPVESGEKVNLEITILLALVVFLLIVGETLPPTPDAIPALGVLFGTTMLMVSISLVMAVIVTNLYLRKDSGKRVPFCVRKIFLGKVKRRTSLSAKINTTENHVLETKMHEIEIDNLSNHSEVETLTNRSRCNSRGRRSTSYKGPEQIDTLTKISLEWQILAKIVDRLCFWIFLLSSIAALTSMFAQIPAYNAT